MTLSLQSGDKYSKSLFCWLLGLGNINSSTCPREHNPVKCLGIINIPYHDKTKTRPLVSENLPGGMECGE